jgi:hypothetical protein
MAENMKGMNIQKETWKKLFKQNKENKNLEIILEKYT